MDAHEELQILRRMLEGMRERLTLGDERARPIVKALEQLIVGREQMLADDGDVEARSSNARRR